MLAGVPVHRRSGRGEARWLAAGYCGGLAGFFLFGTTRSPARRTCRPESTGGARGTTKMLIAAYGLAVDAPLLTRWLPGRPLPPVAAPAGLVVETTGLRGGIVDVSDGALAYGRRIATGEQLPRRELPSYTPYCERTTKLIPSVW